MLVNVPQFIGVEDKIVGPLTAKQLGWLAAGGIIFLLIWNFMDTQAMILLGTIDIAAFGALAFYRPYNQSLLAFIMSSIYFVFRPKRYVWNRFYQQENASKKQEKKTIQVVQKKERNTERIREVSRILDANGRRQ